MKLFSLAIIYVFILDGFLSEERYKEYVTKKQRHENFNT